MCSLKAFLRRQSKFMRKYGDSLLQTLTYNVLAELLGSSNIMAISSIIRFAGSNGFYKRLIQHYGLEKFCRFHETNLISTKSVAVKRGDILESYFAAIEMDISRCGEGYREIREWLLLVVTLRPRMVLTNQSYAHEVRWDNI